MVEQITVTLPDGSKQQVAKGTAIAEFVKQKIGAGLARAAIFAQVNGKDVDLSRPFESDATLRIFTNKSPEALEVVRHDAAHVVASVVQRLFPGTQVTIGPTIEDGFYYDFYRPTPFTPEDLEKIEAEANAEIAKDLPFVRREVSPEEAEKLFSSKDETFKVEIIRDVVEKGAKTLTLYSHGDWVDFCLGPHGSSTSKRSRSICIASKRRRSATTASWEKSWTCFTSIRFRLAPHSGARRGLPSTKCSPITCASSRSTTAM